jgi:hypothetical protein
MGASKRKRKGNKIKRKIWEEERRNPTQKSL